MKLVLLNLIILVLVLYWFQNGLMYGGGEEGLPFLNINKSLENFSYVWRDVDVGIPAINDLMRAPVFYVFSHLSLLGVSSITIQAIFFYMILSVGATSVYMLMKDTYGEQIKSDWPLFLAGLFFVFNPYNMMQVIGRGLYTQMFAYAFLPLTLWLFQRSLNRKNWTYLVLIVIVSPLFAYSYSHPSFILSFWMVVMLYLLYYCYIHRNKVIDLHSAIAKFLVLLVLWVLTNFWWLWPYLKMSVGAGLGVALNNSQYNLEILRGVSKQSPLFSVARLIHNGPLFEGQYYGEIYSSFVFQLISWTAPLLILYALWKKKVANRFTVVLFLTSFFIVLGSNFPTGFIFEFLFQLVPPFQALRNPYEKFGVVYLIAYSMLFSLGLYLLWVKTIRKYPHSLAPKTALLSVIFLICGVYVWPIWYGNFAGGYSSNPWVKVPEYYDQANQWIKSQSPTDRIVQLPLGPGDGVRYFWEHPYSGIELGEVVFDNPIIAKNVGSNKIYYNVLLDRFGILQPKIFGSDPEISDSPFRGKRFYEQMEMLNVGFIIVNSDLDYQLIRSRSPQEMTDFLASQEKISKVNGFGNLDVYRVEKNSKINLIYSPDGETGYQKISPTEYVVNVSRLKEGSKIYFLNLYDDNWRAYVGESESPTHEILFSYANQWVIPSNSPSQIRLIYIHQQLADRGLTVTWVGILGTALTGVFGLWRLKRS